MKKVKFGILIRGPAASGKTTLARMLFRLLGEAGLKIGVIYGDYLSRVIYGASFDSKHLSLKYDNITAVIKNICHSGYNIIIDDLVRRQEDLDRIRKAVLQNAEFFEDILLIAPLKILQKRQCVRDLDDFVGYQKSEEFYKQALSLSSVPDLILNTHKLTKKECRDRILKYLIKRMILRLEI